jgi:hypothetical protein
MMMKTKGINQNNLHEHFPNLSSENFKLFETQRNISLALEER